MSFNNIKPFILLILASVVLTLATNFHKLDNSKSLKPKSCSIELQQPVGTGILEEFSFIQLTSRDYKYQDRSCKNEAVTEYNFLEFLEDVLARIIWRIFRVGLTLTLRNIAMRFAKLLKNTLAIRAKFRVIITFQV